MRNGKRGRYTLEFKQEAARLVESHQGKAEAARSLGVVEQTLSNWVNSHRMGKLEEVSGKTGVTVERWRSIKEYFTSGLLQGEWRGGISPPRSPKTEREALTSLGSYRPTAAASCQ